MGRKNPCGMPRYSCVNDQWKELPAFEKMLAVLTPTVTTAAKQTIMMNEIITAYSTAVGPSSRTRKRPSRSTNDCMTISLTETPNRRERAFRLLDDRVARPVEL